MTNQIPPHQYETILKYMETTNEEDFDQATQTLQTYNFNLQNAISAKLGLDLTQNNQEDLHQNEADHLIPPRQPGQYDARVQEQIQRYMRHLRQKQNESVFVSLFNFTKRFFTGLFSGITELLLPEFILAKIMRSKFYNQYNGYILPQLRDRKLSQILRSTQMSRKPIMFVISSQGINHQCFLKLLNQPQIAKKIEQSFILAGSISDDKQCEQIEGDKRPPSIIICRQNVFQKIEIVKRFIGQSVIEQINVDKLNYALRDHQAATRRDRNLLIKYRNYIRRNYYGGRPGFYEQQQEEDIFPARQTATSVSDMIKQQNEEYHKVEEESKRKFSLQLQQKEKIKDAKKKQEELFEQRKIRKMSIPNEPTEGSIVKINFRCPDGSTKVRSFDCHEKLDLIYHWVETNQEIDFEDNHKRQFELMYGFPPSSLSSRRQDSLQNVFESDVQKVMIREL